MEVNDLFSNEDVELFFIYDREAVQSEYDNPETAVLYLYPPTVKLEDQCALCGQLIGMVAFTEAITGSIPAIFKMKRGKFCVKPIGRYIFCLGGKLEDNDSFLIRTLQKIYSIFQFYHGSLGRILKRSRHGQEEQSKRLAHIFECYLPFCLHYGESLLSVLDPLPYINFDKVSSYICIKGMQILEMCQRREYILAGCLLCNGSVVCSQVSPELTSNLLLIRPNQDHLPSEIVDTGVALPYGVRTVPVYVTEKEYDNLIVAAERSPYGLDKKDPGKKGYLRRKSRRLTEMFRLPEERERSRSEPPSLSKETAVYDREISFLAEKSAELLRTMKSGGNERTSTEEGYIDAFQSTDETLPVGLLNCSHGTVSEYQSPSTDVPTYDDGSSSLGINYTINGDTNLREPGLNVVNGLKDNTREDDEIDAEKRSFVHGVKCRCKPYPCFAVLNGESEKHRCRKDIGEQEIREQTIGEQDILEQYARKQDAGGLNESIDGTLGYDYTQNEDLHLNHADVKREDGEKESPDTIADTVSCTQKEVCNVCKQDLCSCSSATTEINNSDETLLCTSLENTSYLVVDMENSNSATCKDDPVPDRYTHDENVNALSNSIVDISLSESCDNSIDHMKPDLSYSNSDSDRQLTDDLLLVEGNDNDIGQNFETNTSDLKLSTGAVVMANSPSDSDNNISTKHSHVDFETTQSDVIDYSIKDESPRERKSDPGSPAFSGSSSTYSSPELKTRRNGYRYRIRNDSTGSSAKSTSGMSLSDDGWDQCKTLIGKGKKKQLESGYISSDRLHDSKGLRTSLRLGDSKLVTSSLPYLPPKDKEEDFQADSEDEDDIDLDGLCLLHLYIQAHSDTVLALFMRPREEYQSEKLKAIWESVLPHIGDLEAQVTSYLVSAEQKAKGASEFAYVRYSQNTRKLEGNLKGVVNPKDTAFVNGVQQLHEQFLNSPSLRDCILRNYTSAVYGRRCAGEETYFQQRGHYKPGQGPPTPYDLSCILDQRAQSKLRKEKVLGLLL